MLQLLNVVFGPLSNCPLGFPIVGALPLQLGSGQCRDTPGSRPRRSPLGSRRAAPFPGVGLGGLFALGGLGRRLPESGWSIVGCCRGKMMMIHGLRPASTLDWASEAADSSHGLLWENAGVRVGRSMAQRRHDGETWEVLVPNDEISRERGGGEQGPQ